MRKFILHTTLFLLPLLAGATIIFFLPTDRKRSYHYLTKDCEGRGAWMYRRIFERPEPVDVAFLGSSHTINGINDTLINQQLIGKKMTACNLGYCRLGRDLQLVLIKHLIEQKKPKMIVLEVMTDEHGRSHPIFPYLAEWEDVIHPVSIMNRNYPANIHNHLVAKWMYMRSDLWKEDYSYVYGLRAETGFTTNTFHADTNTLNSFKDEKGKSVFKITAWKRKYALMYTRKVIDQIYTLTKENNIRLAFLYIPPYGITQKEPLEMDTYRKYGDVWIPPDSIFNQASNWYDGDHLNLEGANELSGWIAEELKKMN